MVRLGSTKNYLFKIRKSFSCKYIFSGEYRKNLYYWFHWKNCRGLVANFYISDSVKSIDCNPKSYVIHTDKRVEISLVWQFKDNQHMDARDFPLLHHFNLDL